ncbi:VOC family protein [Mycolicibacterium goodii]|uniref:Glyoxalase n=1 Tax=Mycolicibacterium goodii TaxID=134601 RepID=A0A0K0X9V9_MYCGD|nr:glyoxalase [Mycolicibacterium goodii]
MASSPRDVVVHDTTAVVATSRFAEAVAWYGCLFGREPDLRAVAGTAEWQLTATSWLQVVADEAAAGRTAVRFGVSDLRTTRVALADRGVSVPEIRLLTERVAVLDVTDPDGNRVCFVQELT